MAWFGIITLFTGNPQLMVEEGEQHSVPGERLRNM